MKNILLIFMLILLGCRQSSERTIKQNDTVEEIVTVAKSIHNEGLHLFWKEFRTAVLQEDSNKLIALTNFPLMSHGELDDDPQILIEKESFYYYFKICLNEQTGLTTENESNLDYIKRAIDLADERYITLQDNWCRIANMEFEKIDENWKLTLIYFDTANRR